MNRTPAIIGFLVAGALILGAGIFVSTRSTTGLDNVPPIAIHEPASTDTVSNPVRIVFSTTRDLHLDAGLGWVAGDLHLHAMLGTLELMPAAADISRSSPSGTDRAEYEWDLPSLPPGEHRLYLTWAGRHHGNLRGFTDTVLIRVRD